MKQRSTEAAKASRTSCRPHGRTRHGPVHERRWWGGGGRGRFSTRVYLAFINELRLGCVLGDTEAQSLISGEAFASEAEIMALNGHYQMHYQPPAKSHFRRL